jgi:tetratricopeptide (TPR) repeat protein
VRIGLLFLLFSLGASAVSAQLDPKTALLEQAGFDALEAGQPHRAAEVFRQAMAGDPRNPRLYLGLGLAASLENRNVEAKAALDHALALDPTLYEARQFLGQVYYRLGDLQTAVATYETLVAGSPESPLRPTLERWRRELELQARMRQEVGNHFTVSFEGPEEAELAARALQSLDAAYWRIGQTLSTYPTTPIAVVLYTAEQFRDITRAPSWAAASYDGTIRVPMRGALRKPEERARVLSHEFTHALVRNLSPRTLPLWLNEGLATALEADDLSWAESRVGRHGGKAPIGSLAGSFGRLNGADAELAYASSALAAKRLLDEAGGFAVANLIRDLGEGADLEAAFARRMPWSFGEFLRDMAR